MFARLKNQILAVLGVVAVLAVGVWWFAGAGGAEASSADPAASAAAGSSQMRPQAGAPLAAPEPATSGVQTQEGRLDAARLFDLGFAGGLTVDRDTRATLDALSMTVSATPSAQEIEELESALRKGLPKDAAEKAIKMFNGYRAYQTELRTELQQMGIPSTPEQVNAYFERMTVLQRRQFDEATANALFGQENLSDRLGMLAALINQNSALSPARKKEQLDSLRAQLAADQRHLVPEATNIETDQQLPAGQAAQTQPR